MIVHTLVYTFPAEMAERDREDFLDGIARIMLEQGRAQHVARRPHLPLPADEHAPVFVASTISQVTFPDLDAVAQTSALPAMHDYQSDWRARFPYRVVWANHEPLS